MGYKLYFVIHILLQSYLQINIHCLDRAFFTGNKDHIMAPVIERIVEDIEFGEGPHWDICSQSLYFVDYRTKSINRYVPATKSHFKAKLDNYSSIVIPIEGQINQFVTTIEKDIAIVTWDGEKGSVSKISKIAHVGNSDDKNKLNDGKCDALGRLWTGILRTDYFDISPEPTKNSTIGIGKDETVNRSGSFYSYGGGTLKKHFDQVEVSNGIAWNKDNTKMFYNDSYKKRVDQFDFDLESGEITNRKVLFSLEKHQIDGLPDGMTIDEDDNLWIAIFRGSKIIKISSSVPENLIDIIKLPAKQVTSVAWGGDNLDEMYVTTGNFPEPGITLNKPVDGSLYKITGLKTRGLPMYNFKL